MSFDPYEFDRGLAPAGGDTIGQYTAKTFLWMVLGLMVTFGIALVFWMTDALEFIMNDHALIFLVMLLAPFVLSLTMASRIERMKVSTAVALFVAYSACTGFLVAAVMYCYPLVGVLAAFALTAVYFGALAAYGWFTKRDLSGIRTILFSGLAFLIIFALLSMFIPGLAAMDRIICLVGIAVFLAYTAYDTQKIRSFYYYYAGYPDMLEKASIFSALQLYLDFLNLFLYLLRFMGNSRRSN